MSEPTPLHFIRKSRCEKLGVKAQCIQRETKTTTLRRLKVPHPPIHHPILPRERPLIHHPPPTRPPTLPPTLSPTTLLPPASQGKDEDEPCL
jgi:hypothetical protein